MTKIADTLADSGHNVTLFRPFYKPIDNLDGLSKNKNVEIINYYPEHYEIVKNDKEVTFPFMWELPDSPALGAIVIPNMFSEKFYNTSTEILRNLTLLAQLKGRNYDAVVAEAFEISGLYLGHRLQLPLIAAMSSVRMAEINYYFGGSSLLGYVPAPGSKQGKNAGFLDRLNDVYTLMAENVFLNRLMNLQQRNYQEAVGEDVKLPHWKDLLSQTRMYFPNSNPYLDFAVPNGGNIVPIGGFTMDLNKEKPKKVAKLPDVYDKIMSERKYTVLISFGSVIRSFEMPEKFKSGIIEAMKNLPDITFIWKYEQDDDLEFKKRLSPNVYLKKWVPQPALLADPRLSLFVTHGGLGSTMELAYSGVVALMIPVFSDQPHNAMMLARHGGAISYDKFELANGPKLKRTIKEMTDNPIYKQKAVQLRNVLHNQPIDPKQILVKNMEFAVKFPDFKSQTPEIHSAGIIGYYYLDIFAFLTVFCISSIYFSLKIVVAFLTKASSLVLVRSKTKLD